MANVFECLVFIYKSSAQVKFLYTCHIPLVLGIRFVLPFVWPGGLLASQLAVPRHQLSVALLALVDVSRSLVASSAAHWAFFG